MLGIKIVKIIATRVHHTLDCKHSLLRCGIPFLWLLIAPALPIHLNGFSYHNYSKLTRIWHCNVILIGLWLESLLVALCLYSLALDAYNRYNWLALTCFGLICSVIWVSLFIHSHWLQWVYVTLEYNTGIIIVYCFIISYSLTLSFFRTGSKLIAPYIVICNTACTCMWKFRRLLMSQITFSLWTTIFSTISVLWMTFNFHKFMRRDCSKILCCIYFYIF